MRQHVFKVSEQVQHIPGSPASLPQNSERYELFDLEISRIVFQLFVFKNRPYSVDYLFF